MSKGRLIVVVGPTAVGKTAAAIEIAERLGTEIISADSRQIYKELTIGTAKPTAEDLARVKHHFIDTHHITERYDAGHYGVDALELINTLLTRYSNIILCGGSGLYLKAVLEGFDEMPNVTMDTRLQVINDYKNHGLAWIQREVERRDPDYFAIVDRKNPQRLMRALELHYSTGLSFLELRKNKRKEHPFEVIKIGIQLPKEILYERIDNRIDRMIEEGLFREAELLYPQRHLNALQTVGYQEIFGYMNDLYDKEEAVRLLKRNSRRYAKRQLTWFKKDKEIKWVEGVKGIEDIL